jgi:tryptophan synthase alpha chain
MSKIAAVFENLKRKNEKALVLFVTAGDPEIDQLLAILDALAEGGADVIEVGIPFSDPIADGPTIQASSQRALDRGISLSQILDALRTFDKTPLVAMGYYNTLLRHGLANSATMLKHAGIDATIVSDLIPEEACDWIDASKGAGLENVFLVAPTSTEERIRAACERASGFVYAVSRTGVTGAGSEVPIEVSELVARTREHTALPVCVGFGISKPEHVRMVCTVADGAVIGSWLVDWLAREWQNGKGHSELVRQIQLLKAATR